jgi:hypothetical protein
VSFTSDLLDGIAQRLEDADIGTFNPTGAGYTTGQVGIVFDVVPAAPDKVLVLTVYGATDDPTLSDSELSLQVRVRGTRDPRTAYDLDDAAFDVLQNLPRTALGGTTVEAAWRTSAAYMGVDSNGRHERVSNYRLRIHRPAPHRT